MPDVYVKLRFGMADFASMETMALLFPNNLIEGTTTESNLSKSNNFSFCNPLNIKELDI